MRKKITSIFILFILLICLFMLAGCRHTIEKPKAVRGILDLSQWDFEQNGPIQLDGEWEFYWKQLLMPEEHESFREQDKCYVSVPGTWNGHEMDGKKNTGYGYASYRLQILLPDQEKVNAIRVSSIATSHEIWINGKQMAMNGKIGIDRNTAVPNVTPNIIYFSSEQGTVELIIQVSNFIHRKGGIWQPLLIGGSDQIRRIRDRSVFFDITLFGSIFIMAFYHLALYALRKKDTSTLYFSIFCFLIALRILLVGEKFLQQFIPPLSQEIAFKLEYLTFSMGLVVFYLFIHTLFPKEMSVRIYKGVIVIGSIYSAIVLITPANIYTRMLFSFQIASVIFLAYILQVISVAVFRQREGARIVLAGAVVLIGSVINDIFYYSEMIFTGNLTPYGLFIFIFTQSLILSARFSKAFTTVEQMSERLMSMDRIKDEFLANVTHEILTPLSGMIGIAESMSDGAAGSLNEEQRKNLFLVISSGRRLTALVKDILDFSRLKNKDIKLSISDIHLKDCVGVVLDLCRPLTYGKELALHNEIPEHFVPVKADENRLQQILHNLIGNAIKFTQTGKITVSAVQRGKFAEIIVADTGIGISPDQHEKIFYAFEQADSGIYVKNSGTGLGLSITRNLIELHGGTIRVESEKGRGSKFIFILPAAERMSDGNLIDFLHRSSTWAKREENNYDAKDSGLKYKHYDSGEKLIRRHKTNEEENIFKILIVDDEPVNLQVLLNQFLLKKYTVVTAVNGKEVVKIIKRSKDIDMVILDIMMPEMNGYEVCRILREEYSMLELPILMLTARNQEQDIVMAFEAGANDYLTKPFNKKEMLARVETMLNLKKLMNQLLEAKVQFLQAQIKPHFLYNALNTIMALCRTDPEKAWELLDELSNYLRGKFSFKSAGRYIPLEKELDYVQSYLIIEKARFGERLNIKYDICSDNTLLVPPLILQPIVENAVRHGIYPIKEGGTVTVSVQKQKDAVRIQIADTGVGMTQRQIQDLLKGQKKDQGIGLLNVHTRLKATYNRGLEIQSEPGRGTTVTIRIPYGCTAAQIS